MFFRYKTFKLFQLLYLFQQYSKSAKEAAQQLKRQRYITYAPMRHSYSHVTKILSQSLSEACSY
jgi:hypothetical protein